MSKLNIVYFGTPEFASHVLEDLIDGGYNIVGVVTTPDRPAGRGHQLRPSAVKAVATSKLPGVPLLQPESLKDEAFLTALKGLGADLFIVVAFRMLPKEVWAMPDKGTFNLHASLLPNYRGAAPIQRAIMNGESETGVTTFFLNEKIDEGLIILQEKVAITPEDDGGSLHDKLMTIGGKLVLKTVDLIEIGGCSGRSQMTADASKLKYAQKIFKEDRQLSFMGSNAEQIHLCVRAMSPYPAAIATLVHHEDKPIEIKVFKSRIAEEDLTHIQPGKLKIRDGRLFIKCLNGTIELLEIQYPSKKRTSVRDFLLGNPIDEEIVHFL